MVFNMAVKKDELFDIINNLPESKFEKAKQLLEALRENKQNEFENAFDHLMDNFDDTLRGLQNR
jgi:hypothetical protein